MINQSIKNYRAILVFGLTIIFAAYSNAQSSGADDRKVWLKQLDKIARPVLSNLSAGTLKEKMPLVLSDRVDNKANRTKAAYLEAFGRTLSGIAPWLNLEGGPNEEAALRKQYREWAVKAVANAVNPQSKDYMTWAGGQPLVDASFFALGLIRCPWLWEHLSDSTKQQTVAALRLSRNTVPVYSNWILFSGMISVRMVYAKTGPYIEALCRDTGKIGKYRRIISCYRPVYNL